ncbi:MAG: tetratricopeptide repeat protein [Steroidobacteraceae bacterium]
MPLDFLARLKERNVLRVGGVYAVTGYALFQVANNLFPALNLPKWTVSLAAALFLLGFPIALVMAYAFERTPQGIRRAAPDVDGAPPLRLGWFDWTLLGATAVLVGLGVAEFLMQPVAVTGAGRDTVHAERAAGAPSAAPPGVPAKSVAVLPFVNFSRVADADDFADGLTEELINGLAQLPELRVAGRTSSFYFKGRNEDLREIGRRLGVAHVIEGSVRRSGDRLRITAQLIKVADGFHLWSQTYDRTLDDAFAIQTQIATAVARALEARVLGGAPAARDPRAYRLSLIARSHLRKQELADLQQARELYAGLMRLEPANADGYTGFAEATIELAQNHLALDFDRAHRESESAIGKALALAPRSAAAWRVKGLISRVLAIRSGPRRHDDDALAAFRHAVELDPQDADALAMLAGQLVTDGQLRQAEPLLTRALGIDPLSRIAQHLLGTTLVGQGRFAEAERQFEGLIRLYPDFTNARISLGQMLMEVGRLDEAVIALDHEALIRADPLAGLLLANCYANLGMAAEMTATLEGIREPPPAAAVARAALLQRRGATRELEHFAEQQFAATHDPIWNAVGLLTVVMTRDAAAARQHLDGLAPGLLAYPPAIEDHQPVDTLLAAEVLRMAGRRDQAERVAETFLRRHEVPPGDHQSVESMRTRAMALAILGHDDAAIAELERARAAGWRMLVDFDYFTRIDDYPMMSGVAKEPRFRALVRAVEADNAQLRTRLATARRSGGRS